MTNYVPVVIVCCLLIGSTLCISLMVRHLRNVRAGRQATAVTMQK
jgi:hypothetical protein